MRRISQLLLLAVFLLVSAFSFGYTQNLWEKRKKASDKNKGIISSEVKKKKKKEKASETSEYSSELGNRKVNKKADEYTFYNPNSIFIPVKYGEVTEIFNSNPVPANPSKKLIINIQDIHCHYEAQKNIAHILEEMIVNYGVILILVEGNSKDASLAHLRSQADRASRIEVAEDYLTRGMISGEEYLDLISNYEFKPLGIEDKELYLKNLDSFLAIDKFKAKAIALLKDLDLICSNLKPKVFSKQLLELNENKEKMEAEELDFEEYCTYLLEAAEKNRCELGLKKPNFEIVLKTMKLAEEINFDTVNKERDFLVDELSKELEKAPMTELLNKALLFKNDEIKQSVFYNYFQSLLVNKKDWKSRFPELAKYIHYTNLHDTIDIIELFIELENVENAIKEKIYKNDDERKLDKISHDATILSEIITLESAPYRYEYFLKNESNFYVKDWVSFLQRLSEKYKLKKDVPTNSSVVDDNLAEVKNFYSLAYQRDSVFINKTKNHLSDTKQNTAVMITGGFHSKHITQLFKNEGFSYMIISPKITTPVDQALYEAVLKYKSQLIQR
ncbi:MAG: hypothetical protein ABII27_05260 [bacterium]